MSVGRYLHGLFSDMEMACVYKSGFQVYFDASHPKLNDDDFHHNDTYCLRDNFFNQEHKQEGGPFGRQRIL